MTRVLAIGSDRSIFDTESLSRKRQEAYAKQFGRLDIIVFSRPSNNVRSFQSETLSIYPTNVRFRILNIWRAVRVAQSLAKPDVVTSQDPFESGFVAWIIARLTGASLHIQIHTDFLSPEFARLSFLNSVRVLFAGFVLRRAARVRVVSERIKVSIQKRYTRKGSTAVLPIFVDVENIKNTKVEGGLENRFAAFKTKLLIVSRLEKEKNIALALTSFAKAAPQDSCLIVVGEGREISFLQKKAKDLGVSRRVFFEGRTNPLPYYKLASLVLFPSKYDGYGMVIIEALAAGVPVLSTDVGVAREAGAIITTQENFAGALSEWFERGSRTGELKNYPYPGFDSYVRAYCDDILATTR